MTKQQQQTLIDVPVGTEAPTPQLSASAPVEGVVPSVPNGGEIGHSDTGLALVIERLAANPGVDVAKLEKVIELQERIRAAEAKAAFDAAFALMQPELPEIDEKGRITAKNGEVRSRYARYEDIQRETRPVTSKFGFAIRHKTEWPIDKPGTIRIVGILSGHGHSEDSAFEAPMDKSEYRTDIQSQGSTVSYGRRYTTIDLLNIITKGVDDDGQKSGRPDPPDGYLDAVMKLEAAAVEGTKALDKAWLDVSQDVRLYIGRHDAQSYSQIRLRAAQAGRR